MGDRPDSGPTLPIRAIFTPIIAVESSLSIVFSLLLLFLLFRLRNGTWAANRICVVISTVNAIGLSISIVLLMPLHHFASGTVLVSLNGPSLFLPPSIGYSLFYLHCFFLQCSFTLNTCHFFLQYLIMCMKCRRTQPYLGVSYLIVLVLSVPMPIMSKDLHLTDRYYVMLEPLARFVLGIGSEETVRYLGGTLSRNPINDNRSIVPFMVVGVAPYAVLYSFNIFFSLRVLSALDVETSLALNKKSSQLRRKVLIVLIKQSLLPLALFALPAGCFCVIAALGRDAGWVSSLIMVSITAFPLAQALLFLQHLITIRRDAFLTGRRGTRPSVIQPPMQNKNTSSD